MLGGTVLLGSVRFCIRCSRCFLYWRSGDSSFLGKTLWPEWWLSFVALKTNLWLSHTAVVRTEVFTKLNMKILHFCWLFINGV